ncbi:hypothetical protein GCM10023319_29550 [Nocardia iowensis]
MERIMLVKRRKAFADLDLDKLSPAWRDLAEAVRVLIRQTGRSLRAIESAIREKLDELRKEARADEYKLRLKYGYLTKSVLWDWAHGNRKRAPKIVQLKELHNLALASAGAADEVISWDDLERLWHNVATKPAEIAPASEATVAPVPRSEGDRRNIAILEIAWRPAKDLATYISVGNLERANGLIRHVGSEADPAETADAVISCRDLGMPEATRAIIDYAGNRPERDVLHILHSLKQRGRRADADALLDRALTRPRGDGTLPRAS